MKRIGLIILWAATFFIVALTAWGLVWYWLMRGGIATAWAQDLVDRVEAIAYVTYAAAPLVGMTLALLGKLPGTKTEHDPEDLAQPR